VATNDQATTRVSADALSAAHFRYFAVREQIGRIDRMVQQIDQAVARQPNLNRRTPRIKPQRRLRALPRNANGHPDLITAGDVHGRLAELAARAQPLGDTPEDRAIELLHECALLDVMTSDGATDDRALLQLRPIGSGGRDLPFLTDFAQAYLHLFPKSTGLSAAMIDVPDANERDRFLLLEMPAICRLLAGEIGTHLFYAPGQTLVPVQIAAIALAPDADPPTIARQHRAAPQPLGRVIRIYDPESVTLDLRTALLCDGLPRGEDLRRFILAALPLPTSLRRTVTP
jgi:hypothetical protein